MSKVSYHLLDNSVIINHSHKTTTISRGDVRYPKIIDAIRAGTLEEIPSLLDTDTVLSKFGLTLVNGILNLNGEALPETLSDRVLRLIEENLPIDILVKFWTNLKSNPSFNSRKMLYKFLEHNGHPLTEDGCFIAYRGVNEDFKDVHTNTFDNSPNSVCKIDRTQVDDNPNNTCSHGLHVASFDYAKDFGQRLVEVKVNPKDVVCVPVDYNGTKMRVCEFQVLAECDAIRTEAVYNNDVDDDVNEFVDDLSDFDDDYSSDDDSDQDFL